ncbi:hypothetical protein FRC03_012645 [Tulasnella sp. 419]|nr:hypothetical protein FRC03_012645 [Tulasnella sp. 419]
MTTSFLLVCLYDFTKNDQVVAIAELFKENPDSFQRRKAQLKERHALYGDFQRTGVREVDSKTRHLATTKLQWIIRKTHTHFRYTAGFLEARAQGEGAERRLYELGSEDIAQRVKEMFEQNNIFWGDRHHLFGLGDVSNTAQTLKPLELLLTELFKFKFNLDYPRERHLPMFTDMTKWVLLDQLTFSTSMLTPEQVVSTPILSL